MAFKSGIKVIELGFYIKRIELANDSVDQWQSLNDNQAVVDQCSQFRALFGI